MSVGHQTSLMRSIGRGPLWTEFESSQRTSLLLDVRLPPLGPAFIAKGKIGRHFKSISRNGLILSMSTIPLRELSDSVPIRLRLAVWHRWHAQNEPATPYGLLLHARPLQITSAQSRERLARAEVAKSHSTDASLSLELGGERFLVFFSEPSTDSP
jgi:hypothetical protein